jgi:hypothetical protein
MSLILNSILGENKIIFYSGLWQQIYLSSGGNFSFVFECNLWAMIFLFVVENLRDFRDLISHLPIYHCIFILNGFVIIELFVQDFRYFKDS